MFIDDNQGLVVDHLGSLDINPQKYVWEKFKTSKSILKVKDKEYMFSVIDFYDLGKDLGVKFSVGGGWGFCIVSVDSLSKKLRDHIQNFLAQYGLSNQHITLRYKQPAIYLQIKDYKQRTYYEICSDLRCGDYSECWLFGRHFEQGLFHCIESR